MVEDVESTVQRQQTMIGSIRDRVSLLIAEGRLRMPGLGEGFLIPAKQLTEWQRWFTSVANVISVSTPPDSVYCAQMNSILIHPDLQKGLPSILVRKMFGILEALASDIEAGLLNRFEYIVLGSSFDSFLDHAEDFHQAGKKQEAAVLAGVVLEDAVRRIAEKNGLKGNGPSLESLVDELVKLGVVTPVKAKRIKSYAGTRNRALHANWDAFDLADVGEMISGVREIIDHFL